MELIYENLTELVICDVTEQTLNFCFLPNVKHSQSLSLTPLSFSCYCCLACDLNSNSSVVGFDDSILTMVHGVTAC